MSFEVIEFPSASNTSKLSANPTTKIPQSTDWIFQEFFNNMLEYNHCSHHEIAFDLHDVFPYEKLEQNYFFLDKEEFSVPALIESNISSDSAPSIFTILQEEEESSFTVLKKRKSSSSFRSFMNVFNSNKKHKQDMSSFTNRVYDTAPLPKSTNSIRSTISKKVARLFKISY